MTRRYMTKDQDHAACHFQDIANLLCWLPLACLVTPVENGTINMGNFNVYLHAKSKI